MGDEDFWAVWKTATRLFPAGLMEAFQYGMTGGLLRSRRTLLLYSDVTHWLLPGLSACGVQAECILLPLEEGDGLALLSRHARVSRSVPVVAFAAVQNYSEDVPKYLEQAGEAEEEIPNSTVDAALIRQGLVLSIEAKRKIVTVEESSGHAREWAWETFRGEFTHLLTLRRCSGRGRRAAHVHTAIARWTLFACAFPERLINIGEENAELRRLAAEFWQNLAGAGRSAVATRLRRVAVLLAGAQTAEDIHAAWNLLYELACRQSLLPGFVIAALLAPPDVVLADAERRELIYYVRAGTRDIKILAAHRLAAEHDSPDARHTLEQLRSDSDPWVRAMARQVALAPGFNPAL